MEQNSKNLVSEHWRGLDFYQPKNDSNPKVVIIGCGAIGSYTAFGLARLGVKELVLIDFDTVEGHNLPNQFFAESLNIKEGIFKTSALEATIKLMVKDVSIKSFPLKFEQVFPDEWKDASAIIVAVDDMNVRKFIYNKVLECNNRQLLLDARIGGIYANIYTIDMVCRSHREYYESSLYSNDYVKPLPCTGQSICDVSMAVAGELVGRYRTYAMGKTYPSLHSFHDYGMGHSWIQEKNRNFTLLANDSAEEVEENIDEDEDGE